MLMEEKGFYHLRPEIIELLKKVPSLKRNLGGQKAFHEKFFLGRSKVFCDNPEKLLLAPLEASYLFNFTQWLKGNPHLIKRNEDYIDNKLNGTGKDMDRYLSLVFFKAVLMQVRNDEREAKKLFEYILDHEHEIMSEKHLVPLAVFELGLMYRRAGDFGRATEFLKRAKKNYKNHYAEVVIEYRANLALKAMKEQCDANDVS